MTREKFVLNEERINQITLRHNNIIDNTLENLSNYTLDKNYIVRKEKFLCKYCFYVNNDRLAGATVTLRPCGICNIEIYYGSTNVDVVCKECAKLHNICIHCGSDIDMKENKNHNL